MCLLKVRSYPFQNYLGDSSIPLDCEENKSVLVFGEEMKIQWKTNDYACLFVTNMLLFWVNHRCLINSQVLLKIKGSVSHVPNPEASCSILYKPPEAGSYPSKDSGFNKLLLCRICRKNKKVRVIKVERSESGLL